MDEELYSTLDAVREAHKGECAVVVVIEDVNGDVVIHRNLDILSASQILVRGAAEILDVLVDEREAGGK